MVDKLAFQKAVVAQAHPTTPVRRVHLVRALKAEDHDMLAAEFGRGQRRGTGRLLQRNFLGRTVMAAKVPVATMRRFVARL